MKGKIIHLAILCVLGVCSTSKALSLTTPSFDLNCVAVHEDKIAWCNYETLFISTVDTFPSYTRYKTADANGCNELRWSDDGKLLYVITSRNFFRVRYSRGRLIKDTTFGNREISASLLPPKVNDRSKMEILLPRVDPVAWAHFSSENTVLWSGLIRDEDGNQIISPTVSMSKYVEGKWSDPISLFNIPRQEIVDASASDRLIALVNGRAQIILFDRSSKTATPKILTMPGLGYEERVARDYVHQVQAGETLNSIARYYSVSVRNLSRLNNLENSDLIKAHTSLILPDSATINRCTKIHEIQPGETLFSITKKYDISVEDLVILNDLEDPDLIISHTPLVLPEAAKTENYVKIHKIKGYRDCLTSVARSHGVSVKSIILLNNIKTPDRLYYGDLLILPQSAKTDGCEYCTIKRNNLQQ